MASTEIERPIYQGTGLKFTLDIECEGFSMDTDDFEVIIKNESNKKVTITKAEMILTENDKYLFTLDTQELGTGTYYATTIARVPDEDFSDGIRIEVIKQVLCKVE